MAEPAGFVPPPYPYDRLDRLRAAGRRVRRWCRRPLDRHAVRSAARRRGRRVVDVERRARLSAEHRHAMRCVRRSGRGSIDASTSTSRSARWRRASAPRSSWPRRRSTSACALRRGTPCCTRRWRTRPTRWARPSPDCRRRSRCRAGPTEPSTSRRSIRRRRGPGADAVGQQPVEPDRRAHRPRRGRGMGPAHTTCPCSATSATSSSPGTARRARILQHGFDGVVAVHSLSKRSNLAGVRVGFYAGDAELVGYLKEVRKHVGMLVPGPAQAAAAVALADDAHVARAARPLPPPPRATRQGARGLVGHRVPLPAGGFYLWFDAGDGWAFAERLGTRGWGAGQPRRLLRRRRCAERACRRGTT